MNTMRLRGLLASRGLPNLNDFVACGAEHVGDDLVDLRHQVLGVRLHQAHERGAHLAAHIRIGVHRGVVEALISRVPATSPGGQRRLAGSRLPRTARTWM